MDCMNRDLEDRVPWPHERTCVPAPPAVMISWTFLGSSSWISISMNTGIDSTTGDFLVQKQIFYALTMVNPHWTKTFAYSCRLELNVLFVPINPTVWISSSSPTENICCWNYHTVFSKIRSRDFIDVGVSWFCSVIGDGIDQRYVLNSLASTHLSQARMVVSFNKPTERLFRRPIWGADVSAQEIIEAITLGSSNCVCEIDP